MMNGLFFTLYEQHMKLLPSSHAFLIHSSNVQHIFLKNIHIKVSTSTQYFHICKQISIKHIMFGRTDIKQTDSITFSAA